MDRNLALELVRVTEAAALVSSKFMGRGDKNGADGAAVEAMRKALESVNISGEVVEKYNQEIENIFVDMAKKVLQSENNNVIYTVEYVANIQDGILSVMIKSNLKEGSKAQKVIIQTYNYDLRNNKEITLAEVLKIEQLNENDVQNKIKADIQTEQKKAQDLKSLGYNIYSRDINSDIYSIEKSTEFYFTGNILYVIYAYGNHQKWI